MKYLTFGLLAIALTSPNFSVASSSPAEATSTVYFLAAGPRLSQPQDNPEASEYESFVVPVTDSAQIAEIRSLIRQAKYPVVNVRIKAGGDGVNRDFYAPGAPAWNWSVTQLISVQGEPYSVFLPEHGPLPEESYGSVSMIAADPNAWIARHGDQLAEQWFPLTTEINPFKTPVPPDPEAPVMGNLSTRAITGKGQDTLIGGISITGGRPKQIAIRSSADILGPYGIGTAITSPRVRVFASDGTELTTLFNQRQYEIAARFPGLLYQGYRFDTLAIITLYPGQYSFHVYDRDGHTGVVLFELYDLSLAPQPFP